VQLPAVTSKPYELNGEGRLVELPNWLLLSKLLIKDCVCYLPG